VRSLTNCNKEEGNAHEGEGDGDQLAGHRRRQQLAVEACVCLLLGWHGYILYILNTYAKHNLIK
jgi:hypothetical protein